MVVVLLALVYTTSRGGVLVHTKNNIICTENKNKKPIIHVVLVSSHVRSLTLTSLLVALFSLDNS